MVNQPDNRTALTFMAHPDDAEMLCAGTLVRLASAGWTIHVATATAGDCGTMTETPWAIAGRRTEEARLAAERIGATYHCLGEPDGFVVYDKPTLRKVYDLFRRVAPSLVFRSRTTLFLPRLTCRCSNDTPSTIGQVMSRT